MRFISTRDTALSVSSAEAIVRGISAEGGLFVPESFPNVSLAETLSFAKRGYAACAAAVMGKYLTDFSEDELFSMAQKAYAGFDDPAVVPLTDVGGGEHIMELYHGPTLAFKDMALQMLPRLMAASIRKTGEKDRVLILVATSGDTGKAALEGFADVPGTAILVFYPEDGVADMQKLQMTTQKGGNVAVCAVRGNFDDAQSGVKAIFGSADIAKKLKDAGYRLSSANSINWGRLVPQIAYYFWAYAVLAEKGAIAPGESIDFVVPTGNFGDILAGYYAKRMGLPVRKLVCASNANRVLTDFFETGVYDKNRPFHKTASPSMDILISSNLERLLFEASGRDPKAVSAWMEALKKEGRYDVGEEVLKRINEDFSAGCAEEGEAAAALRSVFERTGAVLDPHTAVAQAVYDRVKDGTPAVVLSTASPYKFPQDVLIAIDPEKHPPKDGFLAAQALSERTNTRIPAQILALRDAPVRFFQSCEKGEMESALFEALARWS